MKDIKRSSESKHYPVITLDQVGKAIGYSAWRRLKIKDSPECSCDMSLNQDPYTIFLEELQKLAGPLNSEDLKTSIDNAYWER